MSEKSVEYLIVDTTAFIQNAQLHVSFVYSSCYNISITFSFTGGCPKHYDMP